MLVYIAYGPYLRLIKQHFLPNLTNLSLEIKAKKYVPQWHKEFPLF